MTRKAPRYLNKNDLAELARRYMAGDPIKRIADAFGVGDRTVKRHVERLKLPARRLSEDQIGEITRLYSTGQHIRDIAIKFNRDQSHISKIAHRNGEPKRRLAEIRLHRICELLERTPHGMTNAQIAEKFGVSVVKIRCRMSDLKRQGVVIDKGPLREKFGGVEKVWHLKYRSASAA